MVVETEICLSSGKIRKTTMNAHALVVQNCLRSHEEVTPGTSSGQISTSLFAKRSKVIVALTTTTIGTCTLPTHNPSNETLPTTVLIGHMVCTSVYSSHHLYCCTTYPTSSQALHVDSISNFCPTTVPRRKCKQTDPHFSHGPQINVLTP